ncbi:phage associated protein [Neisseria meningitidis]|nr:phage associated protein [Neisseria meningitidis]CWT61025.1 phage associated protein [Neisseria meningitidis]
MTKSCKNDGVSGGIRPPRHSRESGNLKTQRCKIYQKQLKPNGLDSRLRGNLKTQRCKIYQKQLKPNGLDSRLRGNDGILVTVATACATAKGLQQP